MKFEKTPIEGVIIITPKVFKDKRGFFLETYHKKKFLEGGIKVEFVQDNHSLSRRNTIRGLHGQLFQAQGKLVRVIEGEIFDVAVDLRKGSPTYTKWIGVILSADNFKQLYIPPGCLHGFCVLSEQAQVEYKCTDFYNPSDEITLNWQDPTINISWPIKEALLSERDKNAPFLQDIENELIKSKYYIFKDEE